MHESIEQRIAHKLSSDAHALRQLRIGSPVGRASAAGLAARYRLDAKQPIGQQLAELGVLSDAEGAWLDEAPPPQA